MSAIPDTVQLHGCHVCGADPTHFGGESIPLCANCDMVDYRTAIAFLAPIPLMAVWSTGLVVFVVLAIMVYVMARFAFSGMEN